MRTLVALAFIAMTAHAAQTNLDVFKGCGLAGTAASTCGKKLNRGKNRYVPPAAGDINSAITLEAILAPGDDRNRWHESDGAKVEGIIANVQPGGFKESCNCNKATLRDFHIDLVMDSGDVDTPQRHVIAEITPREQKLHPQWTSSFISNLKGKHVRFTGWMLFDGMHSAESANTKNFPQQCGSLEVQEIWRATAWEIHPITAIEILD